MYIRVFNFRWVSTLPTISFVNSMLDVDAVEYLLNKNTTRVMIYFIEISDVIKPRSLCSVESAARHNPQADIILLINSASLQTDELDFLKCRYRNFKVLRLNPARLFQGTEFEEFYNSGKLESSKHLVHHTSDILRTMVIWRFGGIYMDSDVIMLKPIIHLRNFVVSEDNKTLANAEIGFDRESDVIYKILQRQISKFDGEQWSYNGPIAVSDVILKLCGSLKPHVCKFANILPFDTFHAVPWQSHLKLFDEKCIEELLNLWNSSYGVHFWNYLLKNDSKILFDSNQPISVIARRNCPMVCYNQNKYL
jgi:hypothetical protein